MKSRMTIAAAIGAAFLLSFSVLAQQTQQKQPPGPVMMMSMEDMMKGCREHCQATTAAIDKVLGTITAAKKSNDPAQARAALDQIEKPLAEMKDHMSMCMSMMNMMQQMHGGTTGKSPSR